MHVSDVATDPIVLLAMEKSAELQSAAVFGSVDVVAELCASPRASVYLDQGVGPTKTTALMCAAQAGRADVAAVLLDAGADVDACDALGRSPLIFAAANGETALVAPLLAHGANPRLTADNGWTPLMFACALGHVATAGALLEIAMGKGQDETLQAMQQGVMSMQSAEAVARDFEQPEAVALLSHLLAQEGALDVGAALLAAQEARRGRVCRMIMTTDAPLPDKEMLP